MDRVGSRELEAHAWQIIRSVRELCSRHIITHPGRPVGVLLPLNETSRDEGWTCSEQTDDVWEELSRLGESVGRGRQSPLSGTELLSESRRWEMPLVAPQAVHASV